MQIYGIMAQKPFVTKACSCMLVPDSGCFGRSPAAPDQRGRVGCHGGNLISPREAEPGKVTPHEQPDHTPELSLPRCPSMGCLPQFSPGVRPMPITPVSPDPNASVVPAAVPAVPAPKAKAVGKRGRGGKIPQTWSALPAFAAGEHAVGLGRVRPDGGRGVRVVQEGTVAVHRR
jgi:hypothetical protein